MKRECEFYLVINENGTWTVDIVEADALETLSDEGGINRVVKLTVKLSLPHLKAEIDVPDEAGKVVGIKVETEAA